MKIETYGHFNICSHKNMFCQINSLAGENGIEIKPWSYNCFWAFVDLGDNDFRIIAFPNRKWFKDWVKAQSNKLRIIQEQGLIQTE